MTVKVTLRKTISFQTTEQTTACVSTNKGSITRRATIPKYTTRTYLRNLYLKNSANKKRSFRTTNHVTTTERPHKTTKSSILSSGVGYISKMFSFVNNIFKKEKS